MNVIPPENSESTAAPALVSPESPTDIFVSFTKLALQGFGGVLAIAQRELVENKRWMSREEFIEEWAVAQILPGPTSSIWLSCLATGISACAAHWPQ